jgi:hypothetical protein
MLYSEIFRNYQDAQEDIAAAIEDTNEWWTGLTPDEREAALQTVTAEHQDYTTAWLIGEHLIALLGIEEFWCVNVTDRDDTDWVEVTSNAWNAYTAGQCVAARQRVIAEMDMAEIGGEGESALVVAGRIPWWADGYINPDNLADDLTDAFGTVEYRDGNCGRGYYRDDDTDMGDYLGRTHAEAEAELAKMAAADNG